MCAQIFSTLILNNAKSETTGTSISHGIQVDQGFEEKCKGLESPTRAMGKGVDSGQVKGLSGSIKRPAEVGHHESGVPTVHRVVIFFPVEKTDGSHTLGFTHLFNKYLQVSTKCQTVF